MDDDAKTLYERKKMKRENARDKERIRARRVKRQRAMLKYTLFLSVFLVLGYAFFVLMRSSTPQGPDFSIAYPIQGADHIAPGAQHPPYNSNPPSSGWHYNAPAQGGFYDSPLPDEQVVHNLEHGDIWIAYRPDLSDEIINELKSFAGPYVVVSPRSLNEGDISLVAWGRVDTFNIENGKLDRARIRDFILRYDNRGPEKVRGAAPRRGF